MDKPSTIGPATTAPSRLQRLERTLIADRIVNGGDIEVAPSELGVGRVLRLSASIKAQLQGIVPAVVKANEVEQASDEFLPIKLTAGPDSLGFYECSVYGNGTLAAATETAQAAWIWGFFVATTGQQGFWLARRKDVSGDTLYEVVPNLPIAPDSTNDYYLRLHAGFIEWIPAGQCNSASA
jgi:hypothetical protein